jgi:hypothetical protein
MPAETDQVTGLTNWSIARKSESDVAPIMGRGDKGCFGACSCEKEDYTILSPIDRKSTSELEALI